MTEKIYSVKCNDELLFFNVYDHHEEKKVSYGIKDSTGRYGLSIQAKKAFKYDDSYVTDMIFRLLYAVLSQNIGSFKLISGLKPPEVS